MNKDLAGGIALLALAGGYFWSTETIPNSMLDDAFGPRGLPVVLSGLLALLALILIVRSLIGMRTPVADTIANDEEEVDHESSLPRALGLLAIGFGYVLLLPVLGYPLTIALMIAAIAFYEGAPRDWKIPATAAFGGLLFWLLFDKFLGVGQPAGLFF